MGADKTLAPTKYWHRQNIVVSTQYWRQLKIGINKILASTKHWHRQNIGVDKILALTKDWRWQNIGTCVEAYPYCFGLAKSAAADFSQTLLMFSCTSPWRCWTLHLQSQSLLSPLVPHCACASLLHCTDLFVGKKRRRKNPPLQVADFRGEGGVICGLI